MSSFNVNIIAIESNNNNNNNTNNNNNIDISDDIWNLIFTTANYYVLQYPRKLTFDGTISRDNTGNWKNEKDVNSSIVWADDSYMGLTLLNRLIKILGIICFDNNYNSKQYQIIIIIIILILITLTIIRISIIVILLSNITIRILAKH